MPWRCQPGVAAWFSAKRSWVQIPSRVLCPIPKWPRGQVVTLEIRRFKSARTPSWGGKSEIRNSKFETNSNSQIQMWISDLFRISKFGFRICFGGYSDFGFSASTGSLTGQTCALQARSLGFNSLWFHCQVTLPWSNGKGATLRRWQWRFNSSRGY